MDVFIEVILNWNQKTHSTKTGFGLFGRTRTFFASTQSQNSTGDLHSHMLIWIEGMPHTIAAYYSECKKLEFQKRIAAYVNSIVTASYPISNYRCPVYGEVSLGSIKINQQAYKLPVNGTSRVPTSICTTCKTKFGANEVIDGQMIQAHLRTL